MEETKKLAKCVECDREMIPDKESTNFADGEWDGHTYKFDCECNDPDLRISIG